MALFVRTDRLLVRPLRRDDRAEWIDAMVASDALHAPKSPMMDPEESWDDRFEYLMGISDMGRFDGSRWMGAGFLPDGRIAAFVNLFDIQYGPVEGGLASWAVNAMVERRGFTREAVSGMLDIAFSPTGLGLHRVQANIMPRNLRSRAIADELGMRCEGLARKLVRIAGEWEDHLCYAITADEYAPRWPAG